MRSVYVRHILTVSAAVAIGLNALVPFQRIGIISKVTDNGEQPSLASKVTDNGEQPCLASKVTDNGERLRIVKDRFKVTWDAYRTNAMGKDEINPLTGWAKDHVWGGWGVTLIDSLDTLWLMGMKDEFKEASQAIAKVNFTRGDVTTSFFEVTIRNLGGLISGYDLSGEKHLLEKAKELADVLLKAFDSPSGYPYRLFNFRSQTPVKQSSSSLADVGSCQLEFARLSQLTGDDKYRKTAFKVYHKLNEAKYEDGMYYTGVDVSRGTFSSSTFSFGASGDSFFEYLIKLNVLLPNNDTEAKLFLKMFSDSIENLKKLLVNPCHGNHLCLGMIRDGSFEASTEHLNFFVPGMLLLAEKYLPNSNLAKLGLELLDTFATIPSLTSTGLAPETIAFSATAPMQVTNPNNFLRPELIESLFYAYYYTRDNKYRDHAWALFSAFDQYSKASYGYAEYRDVTNPSKGSNQVGNMPSYFMAETFKYFLLIFQDNPLSLDEWVFNTEAHPFKVTK
ncbi:hypothetical protein DSO57_1006683 [Entomophthora muscae]|uniref:Uncharacterized protein n=1 Tax=Entomophthora muscae TaxID=34485 RepID=A0ACC2TI79_9FUNG|nr:hypothetical protein DSO57_1006683 [Entomophthora muscae]